MEILRFENTYWQDIQDQDNPATGEEKLRCLMIVKAQPNKNVGLDGVTVLEIDDPENKHDRVMCLGNFYQLKNAITFAEAYSSKAGG